MLELVIYKKKNNEEKVFGGMNGDDEQIFIIENPFDAIVGISSGRTYINGDYAVKKTIKAVINSYRLAAIPKADLTIPDKNCRVFYGGGVYDKFF